MAELALYKRYPLELVKSGRLYIRTKTGEIKPFIPNFAQRIVIEIIEKRISEKRPVRIRLLKARQLGFSTLFEAIIYSFTSRSEGFHSLVIAHEEDGSKGLFEMNKLFHERLDDKFKPELKKSNEIALEFDGLKSRIDIDTSRSKRAGRSHTYQIVHKSESAYFQFPKEVNLGIANAVPDLPGTMIFDETTANGMNFYFDEAQNSIRGLDGYDFVFIPWFYNPEYSLPVYDGVQFDLTPDETDIFRKTKELYKIELTPAQMNWRRFTIAHKCGGDVNLFRQEYPSDPEEAFIFSGRPRFDVEILRQLKLKSKKPIEKDGLLDVYEKPDEKSKYVMGCDTSEGKIDGDKSSVIILNINTLSVAAEYNGLLEPDILASYIAQWGHKYNQAFAVVEVNNHGLSTLTELKKIYQEIYYRKNFNKITNEWQTSIGWQTSVSTKPILIGNLAKYLRDNLYIPSLDIVNELLTFVINDDGSMSASEGKHDDRVIALSLCIQGYIEKYLKPEEKKEAPPEYSLEWAQAYKQKEKEAKEAAHGFRYW